MPDSDQQTNHPSVALLKAWRQTTVGAAISAQHQQICQQQFAQLLAGPQIVVISAVDGFNEALSLAPGRVQALTPNAIFDGTTPYFPSSSANTLVLPFCSETFGLDGSLWNQICGLLVPGGEILLTGINPLGGLSSVDHPTPLGENSRRTIEHLTNRHEMEVKHCIFHGLSPHTRVPSVASSATQWSAPLFLNWAILLKQKRATGTLVGRLKRLPQHQICTVGNNRDQ